VHCPLIFHLALVTDKTLATERQHSALINCKERGWYWNEEKITGMI
jgi:hypothetical protein